MFTDIPQNRVYMGTWLYSAADDVDLEAGGFGFSSHLDYDDEMFFNALRSSKEMYERIRNAKSDEERLVLSAFAVVHAIVLDAADLAIDERIAPIARMGRVLYDAEHASRKLSQRNSN